MRHSHAAALTAVAAAATLAAGAGSAFAATSPASTTTTASTAADRGAHSAKAPASLQDVQSRASAAIALRVKAIDSAVTKVQSAKNLGADGPTLVSRLQADASGLGQLGQKIAADTTVGAAASDAGLIFSNYRIIALALPVTHLVAGADRIDAAAIPRLDAFAAKVSGRLATHPSAPVQALLGDLQAQVAAAGTATRGLTATLLSLTPAQWNANHAVLGAPQASVKAAEADLKKALTDRKQILADAKQARGSSAKDGSTSPTTPAG